MADSREIQWVAGEGESYTLAFSALAMVALKDRWGCKSDRELSERLQTLEVDFNLETLVDLLWATMRRHHRDKTPDDALVIVDRIGFAGIPELTENMGKLLAASFPKADENGPPPKPAG